MWLYYSLRKVINWEVVVFFVFYECKDIKFLRVFNYLWLKNYSKEVIKIVEVVIEGIFSFFKEFILIAFVLEGVNFVEGSSNGSIDGCE